MHEIVIVGGGLAGLALARQLTEAGQRPHLFEARDRLGGRVLSTADGLDLGPSWFWPDTQPDLAQLIDDLGLEVMAQHDDGAVIHLTDPEEGAKRAGNDPVHDGAFRIAGGTGQLVAALAATITPEDVTLNAVLETVEDHGSHVALRFATPDGTITLEAGRVVLALPPRLLAANVAFAPELPDSLRRVLGETPTWMAGEAKAVARFATAGWRTEGLSGSAFIAHERAVLAETFDLSGVGGTPGALGGFLALTPATRAEFAAGLPMLIQNQFVQLFGAHGDGGELSLQDWAAEPFTCAEADLVPAERRAAHPLLRRAFWQGRLHLAGAETARAHPGHMAGALESAERVAERLSEAPQPAQDSDLQDWFAARADPTFDAYQQTLTRLLSQQRPQEVTRMAARACMSTLLDDALDHVQATLDPAAPGARAEAVAAAKPALRDTFNQVIGRIIGFNRNSCALRNFPEEHAMPEGYVRLILEDASVMGRGFLNDMDALLAAHAGEA